MMNDTKGGAVQSAPATAYNDQRLFRRMADELGSLPIGTRTRLEAVGLYTFAGEYCEQRQTGGFVPEELVRSVCRKPRRARRVVEALVAAGLWTKEPGGWRFQPLTPSVVPESEATLGDAATGERARPSAELSAKRSAAGRLGALRRWGERTPWTS
jgi:hypothetical protein